MLPGWLNRLTRPRYALATLALLTLLRPSAGATIYREDFEDDLPGRMPLIGAGRWNSVSQGGGCLNRVVDAATSPIGSGLAVHIQDNSSSAGNLLLEYDDIGSRDTLHLSFQFHEVAGATGAFTLILGSSHGAARFMELQIGPRRILAKQANGSADVDPGPDRYAQGTTVTVDIVVNSAADPLTTYTTTSGLGNPLTGSLAADRYDVYVNDALLIDDADPADYTGSIDAFSFQTTSTVVGVDVYLDNLKVETLAGGATQPDFSLTIAPSQPVTLLCTATTYDVTVSTEGGFASPIYLSATMLPSGATAQFSAVLITPPGGTAQLTLIPPHTLTIGTYPFGVQATGGGITHTASASFAIADVTKPQFALSLTNVSGHGVVTLDPPDGQYDCGTVVTLTATPDPDYCFKRWTGTNNDSTIATTNTVTMKTNKAVTVEFAPDCNHNGIPDATDITKATSKDCDTNGVPDECQADTDGDHVIDACDTCPNTIADVTVDEHGCPPVTPGDIDRDGDVDLFDFSHFRSCYNGANRLPAAPDCADVDFDGDHDIDLLDFRRFGACFNGSNRPPVCH